MPPQFAFQICTVWTAWHHLHADLEVCVGSSLGCGWPTAHPSHGNVASILQHPEGGFRSPPHWTGRSRLGGDTESGSSPSWAFWAIYHQQQVHKQSRFPHWDVQRESNSWCSASPVAICFANLGNMWKNDKYLLATCYPQTISISGYILLYLL